MKVSRWLQATGESSSYKRALMGLAPGAIVEADGPHGTFVLRDADVPHAMIRLHESFF